ncbi:DHH family phosphoesterase [Rossellomorea aquimaris]|uniref:DHH family phosphoesterase n=1 Tax=Rossellomorea aquimaris TaxID=189382 RepID=UPI0007D06C52|nr:hypothetical protein [Rossellomorea aquimaris]
MFQLITHNDLDGVACGILAKLAFKEKVKVKYSSITNVDGFIEKFLKKSPKKQFLIITDLVPSSEVVEKIVTYHQKQGKIQLIDHHKSGEYLNKHKWARIKVENDDGQLTAAASLFYQYLVEQNWLTPTNALSEFIELVRLYDTWDWERQNQEKAKKLNDLLYLDTIDIFEKKMLKRLSEHQAQFYFDEFEKKYLQVEEGKKERYIHRKKREVIQLSVHDHCIGIVYAETYQSELGNEIGKDFPHLDYIALVNLGSRRIALRTIHDSVDVSEIASMFQGGGHPKAAGCVLTPEAYEIFIDKPFRLEYIQSDSNSNEFNLKGESSGTLYVNHLGKQFYICPVNEDEWEVTMEGEYIAIFSCFEDAEQYVKRTHTAWIAEDEQFINYLTVHDKIKKNVIENPGLIRELEKRVVHEHELH